MRMRTGLLLLPALLCAIASTAAERRETSITSVQPDRDGYWTLSREVIAAGVDDEAPRYALSGLRVAHPPVEGFEVAREARAIHERRALEARAKRSAQRIAPREVAR